MLVQESDSLTIAKSGSRLPPSDPRQDGCDVSQLHLSQATSVASHTVPSTPALPCEPVPSTPAFPCEPAPTLTELSLQVRPRQSACLHFLSQFILYDSEA